MSVHKLGNLFNPQRIALIGATTNPNSVSGKTLANLVGAGYRGVVYPINPAEEAVLGIPCFPDLGSLPRVPDLAIICTPAEQVPEAVAECGRAGIMGIIIMSAGFREAGEAGRNLEMRVLQEKQRWPDMRIIGPNCLGIIVPGIKLNASFAGAMPREGSIAFISQSGALCTSVLDYAIESKIGFSCFISIGNSLDVEFGDLIDYLGQDEKTESIILYIESITDARRFMTAARAFARTKPIIVYKAGRFAESAEAAASHTGAMASEDAVYDAAFQRIGIARVFDIGDIFDVTGLIGRNRLPQGPRLGIVTNAGGPGVMATDTLISLKGMLAELSDDTMKALNENLPPMWSRRNPVDVLGDARAKRISKAAQILIHDPGVDAVLVILTPQAMTNPAAAAREIVSLASASVKPIIAAWLGGQSMREGMQIFNDNGVAAYQTPEQAIRAFMTLVEYNRNLQLLYETPRDIPVEFTVDRKTLRETFASRFPDLPEILPEDESKELLAGYGIPVTQPVRAKTLQEAIAAAENTGFPVVLKILSPDITHKSDTGGVMLDIRDRDALKAAWEQMMRTVSIKAPSARIEGATIQKMAGTKDTVEMILGIKKDPVFGTIILAGMGGITAELFADRALAFPPINERLARLSLESLKIWPLLKGYRGSRPKAIDKLIVNLIRLSYIAADYPEISELDINPLLVGNEEVIALDARVVLDKEIRFSPDSPYRHLALHPYPEKFIKKTVLKDGTDILLRPIRPEDEPLWLELLRSCSKESIYSRFRYFFHWETHDVAARFCYIDYDREIAIVAETQEGKERRIAGVGRLIADPDHETVEYAILISDLWQQKELGGMITDYCLEIVRHWKLKKVVAQTTTDNPRMIAVFSKRGFSLRTEDSQVYAEKELDQF